MADRVAVPAGGAAGAAPGGARPAEQVDWKWQIGKAILFYFGIQAVMGREYSVL